MTSDAHVAEVNDGEKILVWRAAVPFPGVEVVNELPPLDNDTLTLLNLGTEFLKKQNLNSRLYAEENLDILRREIRARRYGYQIDEDDYPAFKRVRIFDDEARQYAATHGNFGSDFPYRPDLKSVAQWMLGMIFTFLPQPHSTTIEIDAGLVQKAIDAKAEVNLACFYDSGNVFHPVDGIWRNVPRAMTTGRYGNVPKGQWTLLDLVTDVSLPHHRARGESRHDWAAQGWIFMATKILHMKFDALIRFRHVVRALFISRQFFEWISSRPMATSTGDADFEEPPYLHTATLRVIEEYPWSLLHLAVYLGRRDAVNILLSIDQGKLAERIIDMRVGYDSAFRRDLERLRSGIPSAAIATTEAAMVEQAIKQQKQQVTEQAKEWAFERVPPRLVDYFGNTAIEIAQKKLKEWTDEDNQPHRGGRRANTIRTRRAEAEKILNLLTQGPQIPVSPKCQDHEDELRLSIEAAIEQLEGVGGRFMRYKALVNNLQQINTMLRQQLVRHIPLARQQQVHLEQLKTTLETAVHDAGASSAEDALAPTNRIAQPASSEAAAAAREEILPTQWDVYKLFSYPRSFSFALLQRKDWLADNKHGLPCTLSIRATRAIGQGVAARWRLSVEIEDYDAELARGKSLPYRTSSIPLNTIKGVALLPSVHGFALLSKFGNTIDSFVVTNWPPTRNISRAWPRPPRRNLGMYTMVAYLRSKGVPLIEVPKEVKWSQTSYHDTNLFSIQQAAAAAATAKRELAQTVQEWMTTYLSSSVGEEKSSDSLEGDWSKCANLDKIGKKTAQLSHVTEKLHLEKVKLGMLTLEKRKQTLMNENQAIRAFLKKNEKTEFQRQVEADQLLQDAHGQICEDYISQDKTGWKSWIQQKADHFIFLTGHGGGASEEKAWCMSITNIRKTCTLSGCSNSEYLTEEACQDHHETWRQPVETDEGNLRLFYPCRHNRGYSKENNVDIRRGPYFKLPHSAEFCLVPEWMNQIGTFQSRSTPWDQKVFRIEPTKGIAQYLASSEVLFRPDFSLVSADHCNQQGNAFTIMQVVHAKDEELPIVDLRQIQDSFQSNGWRHTIWTPWPALYASEASNLDVRIQKQDIVDLGAKRGREPLTPDNVIKALGHFIFSPLVLESGYFNGQTVTYGRDAAKRGVVLLVGVHKDGSRPGDDVVMYCDYYIPSRLLVLQDGSWMAAAPAKGDAAAERLPQPWEPMYMANSTSHERRRGGGLFRHGIALTELMRKGDEMTQLIDRNETWNEALLNRIPKGVRLETIANAYRLGDAFAAWTEELILRYNESILPQDFWERVQEFFQIADRTRKTAQEERLHTHAFLFKKTMASNETKKWSSFFDLFSMVWSTIVQIESARIGKARFWKIILDLFTLKEIYVDYDMVSILSHMSPLERVQQTLADYIQKEKLIQIQLLYKLKDLILHHKIFLYSDIPDHDRPTSIHV